MDRQALQELGYITPIANLASICENGILCHRLAQELDHVDVSLQEVQDLRAGKAVPDVRRRKPLELHDYANLYVCPRNPMLSRRRDLNAKICVLRVDSAALDLDGAVVTDGNAASDYTRFAVAPDGLSIVDESLTFAEYWTDDNKYVYYEKKRRKCAEVLVPDRLDPALIRGAYVVSAAARNACLAVPVPWPVTVKPDLFF